VSKILALVVLLFVALMVVVIPVVAQDTATEGDTTGDPAVQTAPDAVPIPNDDDAGNFAAAVLPGALNRLSWGAVIAGAVVALVIQLGVNLLGISMGAGSLNPDPDYGEDSPSLGEAAGQTMIWVGIGMILSLFIGGWLAARFAGIPDQLDGLLHGIVTWGVVSLVSTLLVTSSVGRIFNGLSRMIGQGLNLAGRTAGTVARVGANVAEDVVRGTAHVAQDVAQGTGGAVQNLVTQATDAIQQAVDSSPEVSNALERYNLSMEEIQYQAQQVLRTAGLAPDMLRSQAEGAAGEVRNAVRAVTANPAEADQAINLAMRRLFNRGQEVINQTDRDAVVNLLMERTDMNEEQARQMIGQWEERYNQARHELNQTQQQVRQRVEQLQTEARQKAEEARFEVERRAKEAAQATTDTIAKVAGAVFLALVVGAFAAGLGGLLGTPEELPVAEIDLNQGA
jgi:ElaB/YqjD/DUF883 family membrane-anchored ribosome-binding protein